MIDLQKLSTSEPNDEQTEEEIIKQIYAFAAHQLFENNKSSEEVKEELINNGIDAENSSIIVNNLISSRREAINKAVENEHAKKDMLHGAFWCIGGTIATVANIGYIFWGAIVFGGFQFLKGFINYLNNR
jgi:hypothetical protein